MLKHYTAFNLDQIEGIQSPDAAESSEDQMTFVPIEAAEQIIAGYSGKPSITYDGGSRAYYRPTTDTIHVPEPGQFYDRESFYSTLFHEVAHSTGHSSRLDRGLDGKLAPFGSPDYSKEELIAEMGAAFLNASAGISRPTIEQSASYLQSWISVLKGYKRLVISAAAAAQKAADHVLGTEFHSVSTTTQKTASTTKRIVAPEEASSTSSDSQPSQLDLF
jgi:antirestriction protein ArdC